MYPGHKTINQIDHVLAKDMDSDHFLQKVIIKQKLLTLYRKQTLRSNKCNKANLQNPIKLDNTEHNYIID
jgi:hypothetical protein